MFNMTCLRAFSTLLLQSLKRGLKISKKYFIIIMYIGYTIGSTKDKGGQNDTTKMA